MKLKIEVHESKCFLRKFEINGKSADYNEFGEQYDHDTENAVDHGCGDMRFERTVATVELLEKYGITKDEYSEICDELEDKLSFGSCWLCI